MDFGLFWIPVATLGLVGLLSSLRILWEYERGVVFRLGKLTRAKGPGMIFLVPYGIERMRRMDLRIIALDIAPQDTITKDNVSVTVNAVVYFRVVDPSKAVVEVEDYYFATSQIAQTTLRSVVGQSELDELLAERERINEIVRRIIDMETDPWGIEVTAVEIKDIDLPKEMKRAMAKQAEAERERRGKVIAAEGEFQASKKLSAAAKVISQHPVALQLRFLQTVVEVAARTTPPPSSPSPWTSLRPSWRRPPGSPEAGSRRAFRRRMRRPSPPPPSRRWKRDRRRRWRWIAGEAQRLLEGAKRVLGMAESSPRMTRRAPGAPLPPPSRPMTEGRGESG